MKILLTILIAVHSLSLFAADDESKIDIIIPVSYSRVPGKFQDAKASTTVWFGDLVGAADVKNSITKSLAPFKKDLVDFYPRPGELDTFVNTLVAEVNRDIVKGDMTDTKLISVYKFFGNKLIGNIVDRIMEKKGVTDAARRKIWTDKILAPFNSCIASSSNGRYAAAHCMDALTASIVPSAGIGIVYEMSRDKLSSSFKAQDRAGFLQDQVKVYKACLPIANVASADVTKCAVKAMQVGVGQVASVKLTKTINDNVPNINRAKAIKTAVMPGFEACLAKVDGNSATPLDKQFNDCIDQLTQTTGVLIVKDKILNTDVIKTQFAKAELDKMAKEKAYQFKKCTDELIKKDVRIDGLLDLTSCQEKITNDITYAVMLKTFKSNAKEMLATQPELVDQVATEGKKALDNCWDDAQSQKGRDLCIKSSVIVFAKHIAALKLDAAVPDSMKNKNQVVSTSLETLKSCLEKNLPSNISESNDTNQKISECTDKLTRNVALTVAESEVKNTLKGKMSDTEIETIIEKSVRQDFAKCLGPKPSDEAIDKCSDTLKIFVSGKVLDANIDQYMADRPGLNLSKERAEIRTSLLDGLSKCLKTSKDKENCTNELQKDADRRIVLAYSKVETEVQLSTKEPVSKLKPVEQNFIDCTKTQKSGDELSDHLDECNKKFALEFARTLGDVKLKYLLGKALGTEELNKQKPALDAIVNKYNSCLDNLYKYKMADGLTDRIGICTKELEGRALGLVKRNLSDWMTSEQKDATTIMVKEEFAGIIPCLSPLLPSSPYSQKLQGNIDSVLKPMAEIIAQYIEYSPENARMNIRDIIAKFAKDLNESSVGPKAKDELLELLYKNGALDQFIKAMVRGKVKDAFATLAEKDLPKKVRDQLITKENFDSIFNSEDGKAIKDYVLATILKPMLIDGVGMDSPAVANSLEQVNSKVVKMLVASPKFGDVIVSSGIQAQIDNMGGFTKFMAKIFYGSDNLNWEKVRQSEHGKVAEAYIKEHVLLPKFEGKVLSAEDEKKFSAEAERLVKEAVKKY